VEALVDGPVMLQLAHGLVVGANVDLRAMVRAGERMQRQCERQMADAREMLLRAQVMRVQARAMHRRLTIRRQELSPTSTSGRLTSELHHRRSATIDRHGRRAT